MELNIGDIPDLSNMKTEMHFAGFGAAFSAYYLTQVLFKGSFGYVELGTFLASFFPFMYGYEIAIDELKEYEP